VSGHEVVDHGRWIEARKELLAREKEFSRAREDLARQRRALPWERVDKEYVFEGPEGAVTLTDLFRGRSQLVVYHFMFTPSWDEGCPHCSFWADAFDGAVVHLGARDISFAAISRAPLAKLIGYRARMGWTFPWVSASDTDFNYDFGVSFTPASLTDGTAGYNYGSTDAGLEDREGISVFRRDDTDALFHTYSAYARGIDMVNSAYQLIDLTPTGRDEPAGDPQYWARRHDEYST